MRTLITQIAIGLLLASLTVHAQPEAPALLVPSATPPTEGALTPYFKPPSEAAMSMPAGTITKNVATDKTQESSYLTGTGGAYPEFSRPLETLGWVSAPTNLCGGYYTVPNLNPTQAAILPMGDSETTINADYGTFNFTGQSILIGHVVITQPGRRLVADKGVFQRDAATGKLKTVDLTGNVSLQEAGRMVIGDKAHMDFSQQTGEIYLANYRIALTKADVTALEQPLGDGLAKLEILTAHGQARHVTQVKPGLVVMQDVTYTTCTPTHNTWNLHATKMTLNKKTGRGVARNLVVRIHSVPVFYTPYLNFPIDKRRESGFLFPSFGSASGGGFDVILPYYFNLAPNYDATLAARWLTERGVMANGEFRYLTPTSAGRVSGGFLPNDREFNQFKHDANPKIYPNNTYKNQFGLKDLLHDSNNRSQLSWLNTSQFGPHWSSKINYNYVSDDYYFQDFGTIPAVVSTNLLLREGDLHYASEHWDLYALVQDYQVLHPINRQAIPDIYSRLPQFEFNGNYPDLIQGLSLQWQSAVTYFTRPKGPFDIQDPTAGWRQHLHPILSYPLSSAWGFITPSIELDSAAYQLSNPGLKRPGVYWPNHIDRSIPLFNIDSGLYFDREMNFAKQDYIQTLEPRFYYLYVPYRNQKDIPVFDSGLIPFSYAQLFRNNRFSGNDRIGDANQISVGFTTRMIDADRGYEKIKLGIGEILYFSDRRVTLCRTPNCTDQNFALGATSNTFPLSPVAADLQYHLNPFWSLTSSVAWSVQHSQVSNSSVGFQYRPTPKHVINLGYTFLRNGDILLKEPRGSSKNNLSQINTSFAWPINAHWSILGRIDYNMSHGYQQTVLGGIQYDACCWAIRLVGGRIFTAVNQHGHPSANTAVYLQWQFKGLGNVGTGSPGTMLVSLIPGFQDNFENPAIGF